MKMSHKQKLRKIKKERLIKEHELKQLICPNTKNDFKIGDRVLYTPTQKYGKITSIGVKYIKVVFYDNSYNFYLPKFLIFINKNG